jgi:hypothetical protein
MDLLEFSLLSFYFLSPFHMYVYSILCIFSSDLWIYNKVSLFVISSLFSCFVGRTRSAGPSGSKSEVLAFLGLQP